MSEPIVYVDCSEIQPGKLEELKRCMTELAEFVKANEPQLISYGFFLNQSATTMTVIAIHPDSASLEFHMRIGAEEFRKFRGLIKLLKIEAYGRLSETAIADLREKAELLGNATVTLHQHYTGFARFNS